MFFGRKSAAPEATSPPPNPPVINEEEGTGKPPAVPETKPTVPNKGNKTPKNGRGKPENTPEKKNGETEKEKRIASLAEVSAEIKKREQERTEKLWGKKLPAATAKWLHGTTAGMLLKSIAKMVTGTALATGAATASIGGLGLFLSPILYTQGMRIAANGGVEFLQTLADAIDGKSRNLYAELNAASADLEKSQIDLGRLEETKDKGAPEEYEKAVAGIIKEIAEREKKVAEKYSAIFELENKRKIFRQKSSAVISAALSVFNGVALGSHNFDKGVDLAKTHLGSENHKVVWSIFKGGHWGNLDFLYNPSDAAGAALAHQKHFYGAGPLSFGVDGLGHTVGKMPFLGALPGYVGLASAALGLAYNMSSGKADKLSYSAPGFAPKAEAAKPASPEKKEEATSKESSAAPEEDYTKKIESLKKEKEDNKTKLSKLDREIKAIESAPETPESIKQLEDKKKERERLEKRQREIDAELKKYEKIEEIKKKLKEKDEAIEKNKNEWSELEHEENEYDPDIEAKKKVCVERDTQLRKEREELERGLNEEIRKLGKTTETSETGTPRPGRRETDDTSETEKKDPEEERLAKIRNNIKRIAKDRSVDPACLADPVLLKDKLEVAKSGPVDRLVLNKSYNTAFSALQKTKDIDNARRKSLIANIENGFIAIVKEINSDS